jgi:hypothetical protein
MAGNYFLISWILSFIILETVDNSHNSQLLIDFSISEAEHVWGTHNPRLKIVPLA